MIFLASIFFKNENEIFAKFNKYTKGLNDILEDK